MSVINKEKFNEELFSNIKNLINKYKLIQDKDIIAIGLSGGKDSVLTLKALSDFKNESNFIEFDIIAISVDEGIKNYRMNGIKFTKKITKELGIELIIKSFKEEMGYEIDEIHQYFKSACIPCGVFRRNILNKTAYEIGADKIATGHNMDDEIQSYLMTFSRADILKFSKFKPLSDKIHPKLVPRIKPLWKTSEKNVGIWAVINEIPIHFDECPYSSLSLRGKTKTFLNQKESEYPKTKINIMNSFMKIFNIKSATAKVGDCKICGEPSSSNTCMACKTKEFIKKSKK
ncbi:MAG: TIGR00269 family protein [Methanobrevibacter sp.]|jgi:uncharacterized protein (TIGR00269 family)|nr:TIGR00269 family protein [Methanobrevibacter sp.]